MSTDFGPLRYAFNYAFGEAVTAYLTDVQIVCCSALGVMYRHAKAEPCGRFQDGHRLRTSDIVKAEQHGLYWVLRTVTGSFYVIVSFHPDGLQSLKEFLRLQSHGVHFTPLVPQ